VHRALSQLRDRPSTCRNPYPSPRVRRNVGPLDVQAGAVGQPGRGPVGADRMLGPDRRNDAVDLISEGSRPAPAAHIGQWDELLAQRRLELPRR
jgi:hypothetical protein